MAAMKEIEKSAHPHNLRDSLLPAGGLFWRSTNQHRIPFLKLLQSYFVGYAKKINVQAKFASSLLVVMFLFLSVCGASAQTTNSYFKTNSGVPYIPVLPTAPTVSGAGALYINTTTGNVYWYDGTQWNPVGTSGNFKPSATDVAINGAIASGETLTGIYTYNPDPTYGATEGTSSYKWYTANDASGSGKAPISGQTLINYVVDVPMGKYLAFGVTPVSTAKFTGPEVLSTWRLVSSGAVAATNININSDNVYYQKETLNGTYSLYYSAKINATTCPELGSVFQWYRADDATGTNKTAIGSATSKSYTIPQTGSGYYLALGVTPGTSCNASTSEALSAWKQVTRLVPTGSATVSNTTTGTDGSTQYALQGAILNGSLSNYACAPLTIAGDAGSSSTYQWYSASDASGTGKTAISGATSANYTVSASGGYPKNSYIALGVTPVASNGDAGTEAMSSWYQYPALTPAWASLSLAGYKTVSAVDYAFANDQLTATAHTYTSTPVTKSGDTGGSSTYKWYTATDASGANKTAIAGETGSTYTVNAATAAGKYVACGVTPVTYSGETGTEVMGAWYACPVLNPQYATISLSGLNNSTYAISSKSTLAATAGGYSCTPLYPDDAGAVASYQWYWATDATGTGKTAIGGATAATYAVNATTGGFAKGNYVALGVIAKAQTGQTGTIKYSAWYKVPVMTPAYASASLSGLTSGRAYNGTTVTASGATFSVTPSDVDVTGLQGTATYRWVYSATGSGAGTNMTGAGSGATHTVNVAGGYGYTDNTYYVGAYVTPTLTTGETGSEVFTGWVQVQTNQPPVASNVTQTYSNLNVGSTLTGSYHYSDPDGDVQGGSTFKWYRANTSGGASASVISGATASSYTLTSADAGYYIGFEVTPVAASGLTTGSAMIATTFAGRVNSAPVVSSVTQTYPNLNVGSALTGSYSYTDADGDAEGSSTYQWYTATSADGTDATAISGATAKTYTMLSGDQAKYIGFEVKPAAATGTTPGSAVRTTSFNKVNSAPVAISVSQTYSNLNVGSVLTGNYSYNDVDGDGQGTSTYQWYRANNAAGTSAAAISGATGTTYTLTSGDQGSYIGFEVTPVAALGTTPGTAVKVTSFNKVNSAPVASSVSQSGSTTVGSALTGSYSYNDADGDAPGTSTFQWYRANNAAGTGATAISGATAQTYTLTSADLGYYIGFEVTPVAAAGSTPGTTVQTSTFSGLVKDKAPAISYTAPAAYTVGTAITPLSPASTGGAVVSYSVSSLPAGLIFNTSTGAISGTPTAVTAATSYTITATNTGGSTTATVSMTVNDKLPAISYTAPPAYTVGTAITPLSPSSTGGAVVSYAVSSLPAGLSFNTSTGVISGTPTAVTATASYTITATNTGGSSTATVSITVNNITAPDGTIVNTITSTTTNKVWMDRNLGATQVANSKTDANGYGSLYQWCRGADGHQSRTSSPYGGPVGNSNSTGNAWNGMFITSSSGDWLSTQLPDGNLWWNPSSATAGANNPCPTGYHVPTQTEWNNELSGITSPQDNWLYTKLKLPLAGYRSYFGSLYVGSVGYYWSSSVNGTYAYYLYFYSGNAVMNNNVRAYGYSVRCIKD